MQLAALIYVTSLDQIIVDRDQLAGKLFSFSAAF
jgi:hypothetical protein